MPEKLQEPAWAREDAFPIKPDAGFFGFQDIKGRQVGCASEEELSEAVAQSRHGIDLAWWPGSERMHTPAELPFLRDILEKRQLDWAKRDFSDGVRLSLLIGAAVLWFIYHSYKLHGGRMTDVLSSPTVGIGIIFWLTQGLVPLYEGWKGQRKTIAEDWEKEVTDSRFETWLLGQSAPFTMVLLIIMVATGIGQLYLSRGLEWSDPTLKLVGLLKKSSSVEGGEWWRYYTSTLVHGNLVHWLMNVAGLRYLSRRVEVLARWPHLLIVFVLSAYMGAYASAMWLPGVPSLGASGGILGLLGFLLVFERLHGRLVPVSARRRLLAGVVMVAVMGMVGFSFIDNAAHAGGLLFGMLYAAMVFPPSKSVNSPVILTNDKIAGVLAALVLLAATSWCLLRMLGI